MFDEYPDIPDDMILKEIVRIHMKELAPMIKTEREDRENRNLAADAAAKLSNAKIADRIRAQDAEIKKLKAELASKGGK